MQSFEERVRRGKSKIDVERIGIFGGKTVIANMSNQRVIESNTNHSTKKVEKKKN